MGRPEYLTVGSPVPVVDSAILRHCWVASTAAWEEELPCPRARAVGPGLGEPVGRAALPTVLQEALASRPGGRRMSEEAWLAGRHLSGACWPHRGEEEGEER